MALPPAAAHHAQVLRLQPGDALRLFDGSGAEWPAAVLAIGRGEPVRVRLSAARPVDRELAPAVTLAVGMPANDRMDALVEKATELGVARIQPLVCRRSVLRLAGDRAERRRAHWHGVAVAACEQCGRTRLPVVEPVQDYDDWIGSPDAGQGLLLSLRDGAVPPAGLSIAAMAPLCVLSGPEGGLTDDEEAAALRAGFIATTLGPRVLRADTAPLALLAWLALRQAG